MAVKIGFKRRRTALTNYKHRLALVKSSLDRIVIRKTNRRIIAEVVHYEEKGDRVIKYLDSSALAAYKWPPRSNRATAYLVGILLAKTLSKTAGNKSEYILDIGLSSPVKNSIPFMFAKGCTDGGLKLRSGIEVDEKVFGLTSEYAQKLKKENEATYLKQFGGYLKGGFEPASLNTLLNDVKEKILKE
jgi:large subunit ribosomal protein L18